MFKKAILNLLILCLWTQALAQVRIPPQDPGVITFFKDVPYGGYVDSFHNIQDEKIDDLSKAFYAIRHLKNIDLLRARKAYKEIFYSFNELDRKDDNQPDFNVPKVVLDINKANNSPEMENIVILIKQIKNNKPELNKDKAASIIESLALVSSKIIEIDRYIEALTGDDFFEEEYGKELYSEFKRRYLYGDLKPSFDYNKFPEKYGISQSLIKAARNATKEFILNRNDISQMLIKLMATKDFLLRKYPLLSIKDKTEIPFYKSIYSSMESRLGFPNSEMPINLSRFNILKDKLEFEDDFSDSLFLSYENIDNQILKDTLFKVLNSKFKETIIKAVVNNTYWLEKLNEEVDYNDNLAAYIYLGMDESNWTMAKESFPYIQESVWINAKDKYNVLLAQKEDSDVFKEQLLTYSSYALGAVGVVSLFVPFVGPAIGFSILSASTGLLVANSFMKYTKSKEFSELSTKLFTATKDNGNIYDNEEYIEIEEQELTNLTLNSILGLTIARGPLVSFSEKFISVIGKTGAPVIRMTKKNYMLLKQATSSKISQSLANSSLGRSLVSKQAIKKTNFQSKLKDSANKLNLSVSQLKEKFLKSDFYFKYLSTGNREIFARELSREMIVETGAMLYAEYLARGDRFKEELPFVVMNVLLAMGITGIIVSKNFRPLNSIKTSPTSNIRMWDEGLSAAERSRIWYRSGIDMGVVSLPIIALSTSGIEAWMYHQASENGDDPNIEDHLTRAALNTIFTTAFLSVATTPRAQFVFKISEKVTDNLSPMKAKLITFPLSAINNVSGSFVYSKMAQEMGIQSMEKSENFSEENFKYMSIENNTNNSLYLFPES